MADFLYGTIVFKSGKNTIFLERNIRIIKQVKFVFKFINNNVLNSG